MLHDCYMWQVCALFGVSVTQHLRVLSWNLLTTNLLLALKFCISEVMISVRPPLQEKFLYETLNEKRREEIKNGKTSGTEIGKKNKHSLTLKIGSIYTH